MRLHYISAIATSRAVHVTSCACTITHQRHNMTSVAQVWTALRHLTGRNFNSDYNDENKTETDVSMWLSESIRKEPSFILLCWLHSLLFIPKLTIVWKHDVTVQTWIILYCFEIIHCGLLLTPTPNTVYETSVPASQKTQNVHYKVKSVNECSGKLSLFIRISDSNSLGKILSYFNFKPDGVSQYHSPFKRAN
jgi:hypothetical protein